MRTAEISELLQHSTWLRRLARTLVSDDAAADDLVQETWITALRSPPRAGDTVRAWLGAVLRNARRADARGEGRRARRHEAAHDRDATAPAADQLVEAAQLQRDLAELVLTLDEPYRSTVLLRFYEGLDATEIAARTGAAAGTVRWRLKVALDRLRAQLDGEHAGNRSAWRRALAPLAAPPLGRAALLKGAATGAIKGAIAMKLAAAAVVAAGAIGAFVLLRPATHAAKPEAIASAPAAHDRGTAAPASAHAADAPAPAAAAATVSALRERIDAAERASMLARIAAARRAAAPASGNGAPSGSSAPLPELDKDYIRDQVREILPLVRECYDHALEKNPSLHGRLVVKFSIVGDSSVGGLVGSSKVDAEKSTLADDNMRECLQETMYALKLPPPKGSGEVQVEYPFIFASSEEQLADEPRPEPATMKQSGGSEERR